MLIPPRPMFLVCSDNGGVLLQMLKQLPQFIAHSAISSNGFRTPSLRAKATTSTGPLITVSALTM
jgi:hypothetical protein